MKAPFIALFLLVHIGFSQSQFYGTLLDSKTREIIPLAHLVYQNNKGFYADKNGGFRITAKNSKLHVKISALGYKNKRVLLYLDKENTVYLSPKTEQLNEVVINFIDPAKELIRNIVKAIPDNYPTEEEQLYGVINENAYRDSLYINPIYMVETHFKADKISYTRKSRSGNVQLLEAKIDSIDLDSINLRIYGGAHSVHSNDYIHKRQGPLNLKRLDNYRLTIKDTLKFNGTPVIQLDFTSKKRRGSLFVEENSKAVVKVVGETDPSQMIEDTDIINRLSRLFSKHTILYKKGEDQKWRLDSVHYKTVFAWNKKPLYFYLNLQLSVGGYSAISKPIPQNKRFAYRTVLSDHILTHNPKAEKFKLSNQEKLIASFGKFRNQVGVSFHKLSSAPHTVIFNPLALEIASQQKQYLLAIYKLSLEYKINNQFSIVYNASNSFSRRKYEANSLGINYFHDLSSRDRFYLSPSLNYR